MFSFKYFVCFSEMMKLAIARGYQYFGYDPDSYFDPAVEKVPGLHGAEIHGTTLNTRGITEEGSIDEGGDGTGSVNEGGMGLQQTPPKLPRSLSLVNCIQARTVLARLLRFQQGGNNPMYGSPETEPPWWPNNLIRWVDMVDLRYV